MENLAHDPEIGPAIINLLMKIIKDLREENVELRKELAAAKGEEPIEQEEITELEQQLRRLCFESGDSVSLSLETDEYRRQDANTDYSPPTSEPESDSDNEGYANSPPCDPSSTSTIIQWAVQPCMPHNMSPNALPKGLKRIMCDGGSLYWSGERCSVNPLQGTALIYSCTRKFKCWVPDEERKWTSNSLELADLEGQRRELFYKRHGRQKGICYAGTFEACSVVSDLETTEYQNLSGKLQKRLVKSAFMSPPLRALKPSRKDKKFVADKFWSGEIRVGYLQWKRVGFNRELFRRMSALRAAGSTDLVKKEHKTTNNKRKPNEEHELPPQKRRKHNMK